MLHQLTAFLYAFAAKLFPAKAVEPTAAEVQAHADKQHELEEAFASDAEPKHDVRAKHHHHPNSK